VPLTLAGEKLRRGRLKASGMCRAHVCRPVVSATKCQECLDRESHRVQKRRTEAKRLGVCCAHFDRPVETGKTRCWECGIFDRMKDSHLREADRAKVLEAFRIFDGYCQCCGGTKPGPKGWCLDHDHVLHKFRGIICGSCNTMLGMARESVRVLAAGIKYLTEYTRRQPVAAQSDSGSIPDHSTETHSTDVLTPKGPTI